jgi:hypothetical protein
LSNPGYNRTAYTTPFPHFSAAPPITLGQGSMTFFFEM